MKISANKMFREFRLYWKNYVFQSLLATFIIFVLILSLSIRDDAVIIASIGATTFIVFAMPNNVIAKPRNLIGGHLVGLACGIVCSLIPNPAFIHPTIAHSLVYALAVGLSIFIMVVIDTEHPPASATALGVAIKGFSVNVTVALIASIVILALIHRLFKRHLRDLT